MTICNIVFSANDISCGCAVKQHHFCNPPLPDRVW